MKAPEFPIAVKRGSVTVRIRRVCPSKEYPDYVRFTLDYHEGGKRLRPSFATLKEARKEAEDVAERLAQGESKALVLTGHERLTFLQALELLDPHRTPLNVAASEFSHAPKDFNPLEGLPWAKECDQEVGIYTPEQLQKMFTHARKKMIPYLAIGAFAGLRQAEIGRLQWEQVKVDHILVMGSISKPGEKRLSADRRDTPAQENCGIDVEEFLLESGVLRRIQQQAFDCEIQRRAKQHGFELLKISHRHDPAIEMALYFGTNNRIQPRSRLQSKIARLLTNDIAPVPSAKIYSRFRRSIVRISCVPSWD